MRAFCVWAALALAIGVGLSAQSIPAGPDLSGRWNRASETADPGGAGTSWGSRLVIGRAGGNVTVQSDSGGIEQYRADGAETAEVLSVKGCVSQARITKYQPGNDRVTITTWLVTKSNCFHGEVEEEPFLWRTGPVEASEVRGLRRLESMTVVFRDGDALRVDTTRNSPKPGGQPTNSTTIYRK